jgi:hypothetical protein
MADSQQVLDAAFKALKAKRADYDKLWSYYDGDHPLKYSTERLRELFRSLDVKFTINWCAVVVNAVYDRIQLDGFTVQGNKVLTDQLTALYKSTELDLDSDDITLASLVCGESFAIAWKENGKTTAYYHDPRLCHVEYDPSDPHTKSWAAKWWEVPAPGKPKETRVRLNIYYPDRLEYYISTKKPPQTRDSRDFAEFQAAETNPYDEVPVFHFRRERRKLLSELNDAITIQNAINKLMADLMVSAEFSAIIQRWVVTNAETTSLRNSPNEHWFIPAGSAEDERTQVGQFAPADLNVFLNAMDKLSYAIAVITRTPKHYFFQQGGDPSGEALLTEEAPLTKKVQRYTRRLGNTWQRFAAFLVKLETGEVVDPETITPNYVVAATSLPMTESTIRLTNTQAGIPIRTTLRMQGWSEAQLKQMDDDTAKAKQASVTGLGAALLEQQRQLQHGTDIGSAGGAPQETQKQE